MTRANSGENFGSGQRSNDADEFDTCSKWKRTPGCTGPVLGIAVFYEQLCKKSSRRHGFLYRNPLLCGEYGLYCTLGFV